VAEVIGYLKGKCSIWIAQNVERELQNFLGHKFLARGYFESNAGWGVQKVIEAGGATLRYVPLYSPNFNPIELVFHPLTTFLRKAAKRTIKGLQRCVRSYIRALDPSECMPISGMRAMNHHDRDVL
jgi:hypothetical protein